MSDDETIVMCSRITTPLLLEDNETGACSECGWRVQFRPHAAKGKKVCMQCAVGLIKPGDRVFTTRRMVEDFLTWKRKQQQ